MHEENRIITVRGARRTIAVTVTRKHVKNLNLRIRNGRVVASIPLRTSWAAAESFLQRRAPWMEAHLDRMDRRQGANLGPGTYTDGNAVPATFSLWGETLPAERLLDDNETLAALTPETFLARRDALYRTELSRVLPSVSSKMEQTIGVHASRWQIRSMKTRWGSCTPKTRAIRINTALAAYPRECLEFVVAHELIHIMEPSHNARFHTLLDIYCPRNRELAALLKR